MKKIITVLLALTLVFALAACNRDPGGTTGGLRPEDLAAGTYMIYEVVTASSVQNLFLLSLSGQSDSYLQLNANGTLGGSLLGTSVEGATWDLTAQTITLAGGEALTFTLEDDILKVIFQGKTLVYLPEGDPMLGYIPTASEYLYDHIRTTGQRNGMDWEVVYYDSDPRNTLTLLATEDGEVVWKLERDDGTKLTMVLDENESKQLLTMDYNLEISTAYIKMTGIQENEVTLYDFASQDNEQMAQRYEALMQESVLIMFGKVHYYLEQEVGITLSTMGFTKYYQ